MLHPELSSLPGPPAGFEEWAIQTDEGRVHAWYLAGPDPDPGVSRDEDPAPKRPRTKA